MLWWIVRLYAHAIISAGTGIRRIIIRDEIYRGVNYSEKSVRRFLGLENPGNFSRDSGIFLPKFKGFWDFESFPYFFSPNFFRNFFATYNPSNNF